MRAAEGTRVHSGGVERRRDDHRSGSLGPVLDFMRLLWAVDHGVTRSSRWMEQTFGVTGPQRLVVRLVGRQPGISAGELAELLHVHPSTLTEVLRRLTERGALERVVDPNDSRRAQFRLTREGVVLDALREGTPEARIGSALSAVSERDRAAAARVLRTLARALSRE